MSKSIHHSKQICPHNSLPLVGALDQILLYHWCVHIIPNEVKDALGADLRVVVE
jgi:hypothetical protein